MSLKRWLKSPGRLVALSPGYVETLPVGDLSVTLETFLVDSLAYKAVEHDWQMVAADSSASLFLGWPWVSTWLGGVVEAAPLLLVRVRQQEALLGIAFVSVFERSIFGAASRVAFLNELPLPSCDMVVEQNGIVARDGCEQAAFHALIVGLGRSQLRIDEIRGRAVDERYLSTAALQEFYPRADEEQADCWLVGKTPSVAADDLAWNAVLGGLSKNKRWQISRFMRLVEAEHGAVGVEIARSEEQARLFFERLEVLHTNYWQAQGLPGSFRNQRWKAFHWNLIRALLPEGQVQLLRIAAGPQEIGYLYNIGWGRTMHNIQCGFVYRADNRWRPGYASQLLAAEMAGQSGYEQYDLLMGDDDYKSSIGRPGVRLRWFSLFPRPATTGRRLNRRYLLRMLLECYRRVRTSSKPNAQGDPRS